MTKPAKPKRSNGQTRSSKTSNPDEFPRRGEVWWIAFGPTVGGEIQKTRPAVIVSNNAANRALSRIQVVPLTSITNRLYPSEAYVEVAGRQNKAMVDQLTTASKHRLGGRHDMLSEIDMAELDRVIRQHLDPLASHRRPYSGAPLA